MTATHCSSALSSLIKSTPLEKATSVELLQVGHKAPGNEAPFFHALLGDDIVSHIATVGDLGQETREGGPASHGIKAPQIQILHVGSFLRVTYLTRF